MEHWDEITTFLKSNQAIVKKINETFGKLRDLEILYRISQNKKLFMIYARSECKKYINILEAFDKVCLDELIIYFAELELYGVFKLDDYYNFCKMINEKLEDGDIDNISIQQLILADQKQKLVFVSSDNSIEKIRNYVKEYLGADISIIETENKKEITILEPTTENFNSAREIYDKLYNYIYKKDKIAASQISPMQLLHEREYKYTSPSANDNFAVKSVDELVKILKSLPSGAVIKQLNIVNGGNVINNNITKIKTDKYSEARDWIKNNPPQEREITTEYYSRYLDSKPIAIVKNNQFGPLVKSVTRMNSVQGTAGIRKWQN
ncbi:Hypothetical protein PACV_465 [Pacmanvirus A23]|uniref:Hypothetical protein n=1 Tax=Pacmanvirus A23 TaxID=1932881 RepID=UPI000A093973|nr:Hypothetical protein B9W72_gp458 [Pacmanvirus A23]SIP86177.1 Hypothetical protein PACV_465 [Pacmanvirus A23]